MPKEIVYKKLVRDNIPTIIEEDREIPVIRTLSEEEFRLELYKKLREECEEVIRAASKKETISELADVLEVLRAISELYGEDFDCVVEKADKKKEKRGGFQKRIFLEKAIKRD